ncbi:MAG: DUF4239 domain-containing protein [Candidatus Eremiobacteraeota bacterium]|nr:DUF4239 domain-containing protein [Candidatus Eremiobacteraeota bacterium]
MSWVYSLPLWVATIVFIGGCCLLSAAGLYVVRKRYSRADGFTHNDVAGPIMGTVGTVLAVLLTFMVVTVWQEWDAAAQGADTEAAELSDLYHESYALPASVGTPLRAKVLTYMHLVLDDEWPLMKVGLQSRAAEKTAIEIVNTVEMYPPVTMGEQTAQADALTHAHNFLDARRTRLFNNAESVPALVWAMMILVAAITISFSYFFRVASARAHLLMILALAAVVGATFLMIAELDLPFRGPLQIPPSGFVSAIGRLTALH